MGVLMPKTNWSSMILSSVKTLILVVYWPGHRLTTWEKSVTLKTGPVRKAGPHCIKAVSFASNHIKDNVKVIQFYIQSRGVQGLDFVQITFEKCTTKLYFETDEIGIKITSANLEPLLVWNVSACFRIFVQPRFQQNRVFMKLITFHISRVDVFSYNCFWKFNKNKY